MRNVLAIVILAALSGCAGWAGTKRGWAAGRVPCAVNEIQVTDDMPDSVNRTWLFEAGCKDKKYSCSSACSGPLGSPCYSQETSCSEIAAK